MSEKQKYGALIAVDSIKEASREDNPKDSWWVYEVAEEIEPSERHLFRHHVGDNVPVKFVTENPEKYPDEYMVKVGKFVAAHNLKPSPFEEMARKRC